MQCAVRSATAIRVEVIPDASIRTSSPGATSRRSVPESASIATDSDATMYPPFVVPMQSGLRPSGSRNA